MKNNNSFPLTLAQRDIFFDQLHNSNNPLYNIGGYIRCTGVDINRMRLAHKELVLAHDAFGLRVFQDHDGVKQYIGQNRDYDLSVLDFSREVDAEKAATLWLDTTFQQPMEFIDTQLCFAYLLKVEDDVFWYVGLSHHLAMDGWGFSNWAHKLSQYYNAPLDVEPEILSYQEMSESDQVYLHSTRYQTDKNFWCKHNAVVADKLLSPHYQANYSQIKPIPSTRHRHLLDRHWFNCCQQAAVSMNAGIPQLFLAMLSVYFSSVTGTKDLVFGCPAHNRRNHRQKQKVGVFASVSPLNIHLEESATFFELVDQICKLQKTSFRHQKFPIGDLMPLLGCSGGDARLYDISFNYLKLDYSKLTFDSQSASVIYHTPGFEKTPLTVTIWDGGDEHIEMQLDYNHAYFSKEEVTQLSQRFERLIGLLLDEANWHKPLAEIPLVSAQEETHLIYSLNDTSASYPKDLCIHELFERQAALTPDKTAVFFSGKTLSYEQLNSQANRLAHYLREQHQLRPDDLVGICLERSMEMIVCTLAILKAGGAYVPLDPNYPQSRLEHMLADSGLKLVLTQQKYLSSIDFKSCETLSLDEECRAGGADSMLSGYCTENIHKKALGLTSAHLAYVIYTSGSTGFPKGVAIEHRNTNAMLHWARSVYSDQALSKVLASTSLNFDLSVFEIFAPLSFGGSCVLVENALSLVNNTFDISLINTVPSAIRALLDQQAIPASVNVINLAGEPLSAQIVNDILEQTTCSKVYNLYGPSEDTTYSTYAEYQQVSPQAPTIGKVISNTQAFVLSNSLKLLPMGTVGQLYLAGDGVGRGYLNKDELTAECFFDNPYYDPAKVNSGPRLYKTGDQVRYLPSGELEFLGRIDDQVKIRGFRIEMGEIEHRISQHPDVDSAQVLVRGGENDSQMLVAYVKSSLTREMDEKALLQQEQLLKNELRAEIGRALPDYMVPAAFVIVVRWPLSPNGKIDKNALPEPDGPCVVGAYLAPETDTEKFLTQIWSRLLNIDSGKISIDKCFFALGGHSLLSVRLVSEIRQQLVIELPVKAVFEASTIQAQALAVNKAAGNVLRKPVTPNERKSNMLPLSFAQQRMWFIDSIQSGSPEYNMHAAFSVRGNLDLKRVDDVLSTIIKRHEILRTRYLETEQGMRQEICNDFNFKLKQYDLTDLSPQKKQSKLAQLIADDITTPFKLKHDLMIRAGYILLEQEGSASLQERQGVLFFNLHHIAADGWSAQIFTQEFSSLYSDFSQGKDSELPPLAIQYADYAQWQRQWLAQDLLESQSNYWYQQLADAPSVHGLVLDYPRPESKLHAGACVQGSLSAKTSASLQAVAKQYQLTPFMLLHAALALVISRHSNSQDIVIGTAVANRMQTELEPLIGFFVNTLVLRVNTDFSYLSEYLAHVRQVHFGAQSNQDVPFEQLVERLNVPRSRAYTPLFQVMLTTDSDYDLNDILTLPGVSLSPLESDIITAKYDLDVKINLNDQGGLIQWVYDKALFSQPHIEALNEHLSCLLEGMVKLNELDNRDRKQVLINELPMLSTEETGYLLDTLNNTGTFYPKDACIHELFEQQVELNPDNIALVFEEQKLSYRELNDKANQLARYLLDKYKIKPDTLVGLCVDRSPDIVVGMLAILKAGGAYLPLDPDYPKMRLEYMVADAQISLVLTRERLFSVVDLVSCTRVMLDKQEEIEAYSTENLDKKLLGLTSSHLAYVIYTSGSTGKPKGVALTHQGSVNLAKDQKRLFSVNSKCRILMFASINFDAATFDWLMALSHSARLIIAGARERKSLLALELLLVEQQISHATLPPAVLTDLDPEKEYHFKCLIVAGEAIAVNTANTWSKMYPLFNAYGPTEGSICTSCAPINPNETITIGRAIANVSTYVLDHLQQLVPVNVVGELYIGGDNLARGYLHKPDLTAERFIKNPYYDATKSNSSRRLYRTGDLVRYLTNGELEFIGRIDDQVKIRGFRIEPGEVAYQINQLPGVDSSIVMSQLSSVGSLQLVAYVKPDSIVVSHWKTEAVSGLKEDFQRQFIGKVKQSLAIMLPDYMVPGSFVIMEDWPLTPNGKVDKAVLPLPDNTLLEAYKAPENETEKALVKIWSELLNLDNEKISTSANFFDLGGHSLLLSRLQSHISRSFQVSVELGEIFEEANIVSIASIVDLRRVQQEANKNHIDENNMQVMDW